MEEIIKENPDYVKVDKSYIINKNHDKWKKAKMQSERLKRQSMIADEVYVMKEEVNHIKENMNDINKKLDSIFELLSNGKV